MGTVRARDMSLHEMDRQSRIAEDNRVLSKLFACAASALFVAWRLVQRALRSVMNDSLADAACGFHCGLFSVSLLRGRLARPATLSARNESLAEVVRVFFCGMYGVRE